MPPLDEVLEAARWRLKRQWGYFVRTRERLYKISAGQYNELKELGK